jgi:CPA1 family monovalent cation:H+ antiporter
VHALPFAQTLVLLLTLMLGLTALARRLDVPYPIMLVLGGLALGFVPGLSALALDPDLVFLLFLPPILWAAAFFTSVREFKQNLRPIGLLAFGLVFTTTVVVAVVARWLMPGLDWAPAFALGAIVSPPDAVAATAIGRRLAMPRRVVAILEGESLVNDASALVIYRSAIAATVTGAFALGAALIDFFYAGVVGVLLGVAVAWLCRKALALTDDSFVEITLTLLAPYIAWVTAEQLDASAVLACVTGGLVLRWRYSSISSPASRLEAKAVWDQLVFLLNGTIFILIGLELGVLRRDIPDGAVGTVIWHALAISLTAILVRLIWVPFATWLPRAIIPGMATKDPLPPKKGIFLVSWIGMRGIVSLAAALSLPLTVQSGQPFPFRTEIILITFGVILVTLVAQGLSLVPIVRWLGFQPETDLEEEEHNARHQATMAGLLKLERLAATGATPPVHTERLRIYYQTQQQRWQPHDHETHEQAEREAVAFQRLRLETIEAERRALIELRDRGEIGDDTLLRLENELDLTAIRLGGGERKGTRDKNIKKGAGVTHF